MSHPTTTPFAPVVRCASHIPASQITQRLALIPRIGTSHFTTSHLAPRTSHFTPARPSAVTGLFVPLHFRSRERKDHRENFRSRGTFVPWNIRSRRAKSPRTFVPWNFRSCGTFAPQERMFQELSFHGTFAPLEPSLHKQLSCPLTFAPEKT